MLCYLYYLLIPVLILIIVFVDTRKPKLFPPGPIWFPIVGCYPQVRSAYATKKYFHLLWEHFCQVYGAIVGLKLGRSRVVIVSGYDAVREVFCGEVFEGRPDGLFFRLRSFDERLGVAFVDGQLMRTQRKFSLNQLRKLGLGKTSIHNVITNEALEVVKLIKIKCQNGPIKVQQLFDVSTLNALWTMITGERFSFDDEKLLKLLELIHKAFHIVDMSGGLLNQMPFLRYLAPSLSGYNKLVSLTEDIMEFLGEFVRERRDSNGTDFITMFLKEVQKNEDETFTEKQLLVLLEDLFMAGSETTSNTLMFVVFYLVKYPEVQEKIHRELDEIVDSDHIPNMDHRLRLVYLEATLMEVQRYASSVPISLPHRALEDTELMGFKIPKGTYLLPSIWSVHMDENHWRDPFAFRPERFIDENGKIIQDSYWMPFGIGRRRCIGEVLAKNNLFIFTSILLHHFKLEANDDTFSAEVYDGMTLALAPCKIKFIPRI